MIIKYSHHIDSDPKHNQYHSYLCYQHKVGLTLKVCQTIRELLVVIIAQAICLYLSPWKFLIYWFVPHFVAQYVY